MKQLHARLLTATALVAAAMTAMPAFAYDLGKDGEYGKLKGEFRTRYENVEQDGLANHADASTYRLRLGYETPTWEGFTGYVEGETIQNIGNDNYNDGANGKTNRPSVGDPYDTALNQLYLDYVLPNTKNEIKVGRQVITLDNQRFIGRSNFRQNDTTYDAARVTLNPFDGFMFDYIYSDSAHRSLGTRETKGEYDGDINVVHASYDLPEDLKLIGYGYMLDFNPYIQTLSSNTYGGRLEWRPKTALYEGIKPLATIEYAEQSDTGSNPVSYNEAYNWVEIGGDYQGYSLSAVYEKFGGNGSAAFQTPLASGHGFNGWVDIFSTRPNDGLKDYQVFFKAPIALPWEGQKLGFETQYHDFHSDNNSRYFGKEVDVGFKYNPLKDHTILAQAGRFFADDPSFKDTTKLWLAYEYNF